MKLLLTHLNPIKYYSLSLCDLSLAGVGPRLNLPGSLMIYIFMRRRFTATHR